MRLRKAELTLLRTLRFTQPSPPYHWLLVGFIITCSFSFMPPLVGMVSSDLSACLFHKEHPSMLSQSTPSCPLLQSSANFRLRSRHIFGFLHSFYSALPFPLSLPFFSRARLSNTYTSAFPCAYYYSCVLQYKANTFVYSPGSILTTSDDENCILSSTPIIWTCRLFYLLQNQSSTI